MFKTIKYCLSLVLYGSCLTVIAFNEEAYALKATANVSLNLSSGKNSRDTINKEGVRLSAGKYTLGAQDLICGNETKKKPIEERDYKEETYSLEDFLNCRGRRRQTQTEAVSAMNIPQELKSNQFEWELDLLATVNRQKNSPEGRAIAVGSDPAIEIELLPDETPPGEETPSDPSCTPEGSSYPIDSDYCENSNQDNGQNPDGETGQTFDPELFTETITLKAGSSIFAEDEGDKAYTTFNRTITPVESLSPPSLGPLENIFSIKISKEGTSSLDADVDFSPLSGLKFTTTALDLEALLEDPENGLGTESGLLSDISFSYTYTLLETQFVLGNVDIAVAPMLGGGGKSFAESTPQAVPEPTSSLGFLSLGIVGAVSTLKRKHKSSK